MDIVTEQLALTFSLSSDIGGSWIAYGAHTGYDVNLK